MTTNMRREIDEMPDVVERMLKRSAEAIANAADAFRAANPGFIVTVARGSSDHAAHFLKIACEIELGLLGASVGPSLSSLYGVTPKAANAVSFSISQSGQSPDIVAMTNALQRGGAMTIALVNTLPSPLADAAEYVIDLASGPERSVAATKSFVCSVVAGLAIIARLSPSPTLGQALDRFPDRLSEALLCDWSGMGRVLQDARSVFVLGRGPTLAIANEVALKFKETCGVHAEAYSAAEVMHGPVELVEPAFPVLAIAARDGAETSIVASADALAARGASVFATSFLCKNARSLPVPEGGHPLLNALLPIAPYYGLIEALSRRLGRNPDRPERLSKVTETL